jgi:hypothetical protein
MGLVSSDAGVKNGAMTTLTRSLAGVMLALVLLPSTASSTPKPQPMTTVQEQAFSFQVPSDWYPAEFSQESQTYVIDQKAKTYVRSGSHKVRALQPGGHLLYASPEGSYLYLELDPGGHGAEWDLEWTVETEDGRFVLVEEGPFCTRPPPDSFGLEYCMVGDGRLLIQVKPLGLRLRGHHYFIKFGNLRQETGVDHQVFRDILASFRAK